ncbi:hypothetical protein [Caldalkalibacillus mannanilyticus]|uniref:hypothetical protein n=1 Tax=Caldalkalibacillus mannanilyticus TaxID=1418 RepID=UPI00046A762F|nr:hypothetical protein [Caldalkalibacillus mannanilyticus]
MYKFSSPFFYTLLLLIGSSAIFHFAFKEAVWPDYYTLFIFIYCLVAFVFIKYKNRKKKD